MKDLTESFGVIEKSLSFLKICSKPTFFPSISDYSKYYLKCNLQETDLFRVIAICPELYNYSYEVNEKTKNYELYIHKDNSKVASQSTIDDDTPNNTQRTLEEQKSSNGNPAFLKNLRTQMWNDSIYAYLFDKHEEFLTYLKMQEFELPLLCKTYNLSLLIKISNRQEQGSIQL